MRRHTPRWLALAVLLAAGFAHAAPVPPLRAPAGTGAFARRALPALAAPAADGPAGACATRLEAVADAIAAHAARAPVARLATTQSFDHDGIAVLEDDGSFFYPDKGGLPLLDLAEVTRAYYRTHDDDVDFLCIYLASGMSQWLGSPGALAAAWPVRNDTQGIGLATFDVGQAFGSPSRLQLVTTMNALSRYPDDPDAPIGGPGDSFSTMDVLAHEIAHRWLAYTFVDSAGTASPALLGRDWQHWNFFFDADSSFMEGCDWAAVGADSFVTDGVSSTYGALDQYLMGMRTRAEIDSFFVVNDPTDLDPPGVYVPYSIPWPGVGCHGRATWWHVPDIERVHGPRVPDGAVAPRHFRVGFVLLVPNGSAPTSADLAKLQVIRGRFPGTFAAATWMRGSVDESLASHAGTVVIEHTPLPDTETPGEVRALGARVTMSPGGIALAVAPGSVRLHWRSDESGPFAELALAPVAPDSFAVAFPVPAAAGVVEYWLSAASDSQAIAAQLPAAGAGAPFRFAVGRDTTPPVIAYAPVPLQGFERLPQQLLARVTDNLGVDSVWCEASVDGGPLALLPATRAGRDSFTVSLGAGIGAGHAIAWRFVARDAAAAHNLAWSNPAFDTLRTGVDWYDDFENPCPYVHYGVMWSRRDAWHVDAAQSSPPGGTAWHCGSDDGTPYEPHQDGVLMLPYLYADVGPGLTMLFDERHRLEQEAPGLAFDAARIEVEQGTGPWQVVEPTPGYTHAMDEADMPFAAGSACWSGDSKGWVTRRLDLAPFAPGPVRVRIRVCTDELVGDDGVWVDHVRFLHAGGGSVAVGADAVAFAAGPAWPNPTRGALRLPLSLPRAARVEWTLHDVQGRRVAVLWSGARAAGRGALEARVPAALAPGLYFSRLGVDGRVRDARRVALTR